MDNKKLGVIILIAGFVIASIIFGLKIGHDLDVEKRVQENNSCYLKDGTCLHEDPYIWVYIAGWVFSAAIIALGIYLIMFEKSQKAIISTLEKQKQILGEDEKFDILLKGLNVDEKKVITAVREQDGITQQTLRLRTDLHKSKLSIVLDSLESKELIKRIPKGKTNQVFIKAKI